MRSRSWRSLAQNIGTFLWTLLAAAKILGGGRKGGGEKEVENMRGRKEGEKKRGRIREGE